MLGFASESPPAGSDHGSVEALVRDSQRRPELHATGQQAGSYKLQGLRSSSRTIPSWPAYKHEATRRGTAVICMVCWMAQWKATLPGMNGRGRLQGMLSS